MFFKIHSRNTTSARSYNSYYSTMSCSIVRRIWKIVIKLNRDVSLGLVRASNIQKCTADTKKTETMGGIFSLRPGKLFLGAF